MHEEVGEEGGAAGLDGIERARLGGGCTINFYLVADRNQHIGEVSTCL